uniref:Uncharacterized protein n=1 Tax=Clostridium perfringens TaxID=1502 RepID=A0A4Y5T4Z8_CLOPF|nr:hypothetical protein [Clostridium perfringens]
MIILKKKKIDNLILNRNIEALNKNIEVLNEGIKTLNNKKLSLKEKSNKNINILFTFINFLIAFCNLAISLINYNKYITIIFIIMSAILMIFSYFYFYIETFKNN